MSPVKLVAKYEGHCEHGVYVGGMGADLMCGACEDGISDEQWFDNKVWDWVEDFERAAHLDVLKEKLQAKSEWSDWLVKHPECQYQTTPELVQQFLQWCDNYGLDEQEKQQKLGLVVGYSHRQRNDRDWEYIGKRDKRETEIRSRYEAREAVLREQHQAQLKTLIEEKELLRVKLQRGVRVFDAAIERIVKLEGELEFERNLGQENMDDLSDMIALGGQRTREGWEDRWSEEVHGKQPPEPYLVNGVPQY